MKARLRGLLEAGDNAGLVALASRNRRVLSYLTALTYDGNQLVADRAVEMLGLAAGALSDTDAEFVRGHLRRLFWLLNDESGGIGWRAAEAIGEIIRSRPERFAEFIPNLVSLLDMEAEDAARFRVSILRAIGRVAEVAPEALQGAVPLIRPLLDDPDAETRRLAQRCHPLLVAGDGR